MIKRLAVLTGAAVALALPNAVAPAAAAPITGSFTVVLTGSTVSTSALSTIREAGGSVISRMDEIGVLQVRAADSTKFLSSIVGRPGVASVGPSLRWKLGTRRAPADAAPPKGASSDPADYTWNIDRVTGNGAAWRHESGTKSVVVGVVDTGFDLEHPDLKANIVPGSKTFVPGTTDARDAIYHGTHVAGTIAANGAIKGVAPDAGIRAYRVFGAEDYAETAWITAAIVAAAKDGVDVINLSLGGWNVNGQVFYTDPTTGRRIALGNDVADRLAYERAIRYAVSRNVTVVAAAGNDALNITDRTSATRALNQLLVDSGASEYSVVGATVVVPALLPGVVTVSATGGGFGTPDRLAFYSNYGQGAIDVSAPGGDLGPHFPESQAPDAHKHLVLSTTPTYLPCPPLPTSVFNCRYGWAAGTSMASPHVAGVAALIISGEFKRTGVKPSATTVVRRLTQRAEDIGKVGHDGLHGHGLVDALSAVTAR